MAEPLPLYVQDEPPQSSFDVLLTRIAAPISTTCPDARIILESFIESQKAPAYEGPKTSKSPADPIDRYPLVQRGHIPDDLTLVKQEIVNELFTAIRRGDNEAIALLIQHNLVTANTTSKAGQTPLLTSILAENLAIVKGLLELGADCDGFGVVFGGGDNVRRTPLMLAASRGSLPIVKLLCEPPYSAKDALVAPDGQIALRLASENGHRPIVDYLPPCRAGGFLRFKTHNARSIERMKYAFRQLAEFIKFFVWHLPRFFVWSIPKHLLVLPVVRICKWCWANKKRFGGWCKHQLTEMPKRVVNFGKAVWNVAKKAPKAVWKAVKKTPEVIWKAIKQVAEDVKNLVKALWNLLTVRIPNAIRIAVKWAWGGLSSLARAIGEIFLRFLSFLHLVFEAAVTFFRNLTLRDIWNAFCDFLRAIFVTVPKTLWSWIEKFGEGSYRFMKALLGNFGVALWWIVTLLKDLVVFIPEKLGVILLAIGGSFRKAFSEIMVWINPKA